MPADPLAVKPTDPAACMAAVRAAVLSGMGRPPGMYELAVRPFWGDRFRVNVLFGPDGLAVRIAHSDLDQVAVGGRVLSAAPPLVRRHP